MKIGEKLMNFDLPAVNGRRYSNFDFADKYALLVVITCNHCPYARAYWKRLISLAQRYEEDNLGIAAISVNDASQYPDDSFENMKKLSDELQFPFPYLYDESQETARTLGATRTPEVYLFNSRRELIYRGAIDDAWDNEAAVMRVYLEDAIEYCLDGLEVDYPEIPAVGCSIKWKKA